MRKKCDVCGHKIESWDEVCPNCGNKIFHDDKDMALNRSRGVIKKKRDNSNDGMDDNDSVLRRFIKWISPIIEWCTVVIGPIIVAIIFLYSVYNVETIQYNVETIQDKVQIIGVEEDIRFYDECLTKVSYKGKELLIELPTQYEEIVQLCEGFYVDAEIEVKKQGDDISYEIESVELPDNSEDLQKYKEESKQDVGEFIVEKKNKDDEVTHEDVLYELEEKKSENTLDAIEAFFKSFIQ